MLKKKSKKCKWNQWFVIVKCQFKLDWNCIPSYMNLSDICQWKEKQIQMWISVNEIGSLFLSFFPKAQSRAVADITLHTLKSPSLVLVSNRNSRCNYTWCHPRKIPLTLHKWSAFLWDGQNRKVNTARNYNWKVLSNLHGVIYRSTSLWYLPWVTATKSSPLAGANTSLPIFYCADRNNQPISLKLGKWCYLLFN